MLEPTTTTEDSVLLHTHLVRGGFLMLQPTTKKRAVQFFSIYQPRVRWVLDAAA